MKSFLLCFYLFTYDLNKKQEKKNLLTVMCNKDINVKKFNGQKKKYCILIIDFVYLKDRRVHMAKNTTTRPSSIFVSKKFVLIIPSSWIFLTFLFYIWFKYLSL